MFLTKWSKRRSLPRSQRLTCLRPIRTSTAWRFPASHATALRRIRMVKSELLNTFRWSTKDFRSSTRQLELRCLDHQASPPVSYTHLRAHETPEHLVCR